MSQNPPFDRDAAQAALPAWCWQNPAAPSGVLADYARYYALDRLLPGAQHGMGALDIAGYRIALQSWRPPQARGTVLVLHGYYDHVGIFDRVIERILAAGFAVLALDWPGHGLSSGAPAAINSFDEYQTVLNAVIAGMTQAALPQPWSVVAQSTGGAIVLDYLLRHGADRQAVPFAQAILLAPLVRPVNWRLGSLTHCLLSPFVSTIARQFAVNSHDEEFLDFLSCHDPLQARRLSVRWVGALKHWIVQLEKRQPVDFPLTVIQGDADGTVDWQHNLAVIAEKFPGVSIHMIAEARHQLANESPAFRGQVLEHMAKVLG